MATPRGAGRVAAVKLAHTATGSGPDLVLLHGWGMNRAVWAPLVKELRYGFRIHLVDLPGHGESSWDPAVDDLAQWGRAVLEVVPSGATWIGWSLGGLVAQQAAALAPGCLQALVCIATTPSFVRRQAWRPALEEGLLEQFARQLEQDHGATLMRFLALQFQGVANGRLLQRQAMGLLSSLPAPRSEGLAAGLELLRQNDLRKELSQLDLPVQWLLGERDRLVPAALGDLLPGLLPTVVVESIPEAGHAPFLSHPRPVAEAIRRFLSHE